MRSRGLIYRMSDSEWNSPCTVLMTRGRGQRHVWVWVLNCHHSTAEYLSFPPPKKG
jgi:hypothetical protein